jgi:hypothetical protein
MSPPLDSLLTEKSARTRTDTRTTTGAFRGTDGSNPLPSSGESANHRFRCGDGSFYLVHPQRIDYSMLRTHGSTAGRSQPGSDKFTF